ncbi:MAG: NAD(P)H-hydrate dehydratase [Candidatus Hydrothermarchaeaceae archaeon]
MDYITPEQMRAVEINSEYLGVTRAALMENAGRQVFLALKKRFTLRGKVVAVYCGTGNNGGDGFVAARHLTDTGANVSVILVGRSVKTLEARRNFEAVKGLVCKKPPETLDILIDAILGTGIRGVLKEPARSAVRQINRSKAFKLSVDVPTGLNPDTGKGGAVRADLVVTFHRAKKGLDLFDTQVVDIGVPAEAETQVGPGNIIANLKRKKDSHKGENGRVLIVGGGDAFHGAPILCGLGAFRSGADLVYLYVPGGNFDATRAFSPDFIVRKYEGDFLSMKSVRQIIDFSKGCDALVIGPGLGDREDTKNAVIEILKGVKIPTVIDADAIKAVAEHPEVLKDIDAVITPHTREFTVLAKGSLPEDIKKRMAVISKHAKRLSSGILLKSPTDIIASPGTVKVNTTGNAGMTAGGTGDVLAGVIAGFISQGMGQFESACCAAFINGAAGDELARWKGNAYTASDLAGEIPYAIKKILDLESGR